MTLIVILIKVKCQELLITYFKSVDRQEALDGLIGLSYGWIKPGTDQSLNQHVEFVTEENGSVKLITSNNIQDDHWNEDSNNRIECLKNLLKSLQSDGLAGDFFVFLLKKLTDIIRQETGSVTVNQNEEQVKEEELLIEIEKKTLGKLDSFNQRLIILNLIAVLSETLDSSCFQSHQQILEFVKATLERGVEICKHTEDDIFTLFESETMTMAIGLLTALMSDSNQKFTEEDKSKMEELVPLLNELAVNHPSDEIQEMATDIKIAIATRGIVISEISKSKRENKVPSDEVKEKLKETKPLIEVLSETPPMASGLSETTRSNINNVTKPDLISNIDQKSVENIFIDSDSKLKEVFEELCHPEIPIRGHALLTLTKLIESQDKDIVKYQDTVLNILEQNLGHADTYLYLPSVNGMVAMANILPDKVVPRLATEFSKITGQKTSLQSEHKIKVGEALVKTSRVLGDMLPKYKNILLPAVLCGVKDTDPLIRASSLSNLTELSQLLHFSIGSHIHEIISCCGSILKSDVNDEARKAAALVFTHLLQGTGRDSFQILGTALKDLYRLLKSVYITESNDIVKTHITLALNELDQIMKEFLFPKQTLTKKIQVLSAD
ncbi:hypothetical protein LOTGIDRAFT_163518 [Lottia gigantea]|uniref:RNA polymerase II assembly factor Rtp1 C-terminal domain-containing protein n=1 Tax=Lottia gigantea TaxID=225164 RepID=V4A2T4_LOTGI|nr:hypothetical protein LOTGIDRAFT_163518 [Lottia gigantea]ESO91002.1 hypothetical protein LOTGIDRAFT_163518 [Lottia gigantea]